MNYEVNSIKFFLRLKNLKIDGIEDTRTKIGRYKSLDIAKLEVYFKITHDDISDDINNDSDIDTILEI